jgi:hypothetical protein
VRAVDAMRLPGPRGARWIRPDGARPARLRQSRARWKREGEGTRRGARACRQARGEGRARLATGDSKDGCLRGRPVGGGPPAHGGDTAASNSLRTFRRWGGRGGACSKEPPPDGGRSGRPELEDEG